MSMVSKYSIKLTDKNMAPIIGLNGNPIESHFDSLYSISLEVDYLLSQLRSVKDSSSYFITVHSEFRTEAVISLTQAEMTSDSIVEKLNLVLH